MNKNQSEITALAVRNFLDRQKNGTADGTDEIRARLEIREAVRQGLSLAPIEQRVEELSHGR